MYSCFRDAIHADRSDVLSVGLSSYRPLGICFSNYTIQPIYRPSNPSKPCLTCTKQWCLDQKLAICADANIGDQNPDTASGKEGDVETRCFREYDDEPSVLLQVILQHSDYPHHQNEIHLEIR